MLISEIHSISNTCTLYKHMLTTLSKSFQENGFNHYYAVHASKFEQSYPVVNEFKENGTLIFTQGSSWNGPWKIPTYVVIIILKLTSVCVLHLWKTFFWSSNKFGLVGITWKMLRRHSHIHTNRHSLTLWTHTMDLTRRIHDCISSSSNSGLKP